MIGLRSRAAPASGLECLWRWLRGSALASSASGPRCGAASAPRLRARSLGCFRLSGFRGDSATAPRRQRSSAYGRPGLGVGLLGDRLLRRSGLLGAGSSAGLQTASSAADSSATGSSTSGDRLLGGRLLGDRRSERAPARPRPARLPPRPPPPRPGPRRAQLRPPRPSCACASASPRRRRPREPSSSPRLRLLGARALRLLLGRRSLFRGLVGLGFGRLLLVSHAYVVLSISASRSLRMVRMRAISRFARRRRAEFSSAPVADWKRRLNSSCRVSSRCCCQLGVAQVAQLPRPHYCLANRRARLPLHDLRPHRELGAREAERLLGERLRNAGELEHHAARLDDGDPVLGRALAGAHARLGRLLGHRLVREDVDPDLAAALDLARHRDPGRLDLAVGQPAGVERLQPVVAEGDRVWPFEVPARRPRCCLRYLVFFGSSISRSSPPSERSAVSGASASARRLGRSTCGCSTGGSVTWGSVTCGSAASRLARRGAGTRHRAAATAAAAAPATPAARATRPARAAGPPPRRRRTGPRPSRSACRPRPLSREAESPSDAPPRAACLILVAEPRVLLREALVALRHDLALVDPDLDADPAERRLRLAGAVVDVRADRVQRDAALRVALDAAHLAAAETAAALDLHAVGAGAHRRGERALHRAPEADAVLELLRDRLGDELRVQLGALDLVDVDVDVLVRHAVHVLAQRVDLDARLADHDPGRAV